MPLPIRLARSLLEGLSVAVLATAAMLLLRYSINGYLQGHLPLMASTLAVIVAAWYGGLWPGLLATVLSGVLGVSLFLKGGWMSIELADAMLLAGFAFIGAVTSLLFEALHAARARVDEQRVEVLGLGHFKALFETQPTSILVMDRDLRIVGASDAYLRFTSRARGDIVGQHVFEAFPDDAEALGIGVVRASFERVLATGRAEQLPIQQYSVQRPESEGGGFKKILWSLYHFPVRGPDGDVALVVQHAEDVTEFVNGGSKIQPASQEDRDFEHARLLTEANRKLGAANERLAFFAGLSESTRPLVDPQQIVATIAEKLGRHLGANRCLWAEIADDGLHGEVLGHYVDGAPSIRGHHYLPALGLPRLMRGKTCIAITDIEAEPEVSAYLPAYRDIQARGLIVVYLRKEGRAVAAMAVHQSVPRAWTTDEVELVEQCAERCWDSLERARALRAVTDSEARLRGLLDAMPARVGTVTAEGRVDYLHPSWAAYTGLKFDDVSGALWPRMFHPDDLPEYRRARDESLKSGKPFAHEVRVCRHDGEYRWHLAQMAPVRNADGRILSWVSTTTEVHELKLAQQRLRDADRAKDEFLATLAHELRNPIAPIANGVQLLQKAGEDHKLRSQMLALMSRQLAQMVRLVDDLLDVSRITTGKLILRNAPVMLADVVRNAIESVDPLIRASGQELEIVLPDDPVVLHGDATRLAQVLGNLLTNSAKYTDGAGTIRLSAVRENSEVRIAVQDQGIGIAPEVLPRVFDLFAQSDRALTRAQGGLGIGLSLVRRLVEMHGGRVEGASEGIGRGATFTIFLPLSDSQASGADAPSAGLLHAAGSLPATKRRVLVADDNDDNARSLAALLRIWGHEVAIAHDGVMALELAAAFKPDVMVLDLGMPRRDGLETAREVRAQEWGHGITLIALSGWGQPADRERTRAAGFDHHLVKPVDAARLEKLLESEAGP
ncbi:MAG: ATP-binding protein [Panacagrimonas sp.]